MKRLILDQQLTSHESLWPLCLPTEAITPMGLFVACEAAAPQDGESYFLRVHMSHEAQERVMSLWGKIEGRHTIELVDDDSPERHDFIAGQWVSRGRYATPSYYAAAYEDAMISHKDVPLAMLRYRRVGKLKMVASCGDLAISACERVMDAIAGHTDWHPDPSVDVDNWNEEAHIEVTLTVGDCRAIKKALAAAGKLGKYKFTHS